MDDPSQLLSKYCIISETFDTSKLVKNHPARFRNNNKKVLHSLACPEEAFHTGSITFSRWKEIGLPRDFPPKNHTTRFVLHEGTFTYDYTPDLESPSGAFVQWHLNFADRELFLVYGGPLFAQDESQVAEHPALGSLKEYLQKARVKEPRLAPLTRENNRATPCLIQGVERRISVDTAPNPKEGRPNGLYGNNFMQANEEAIKKATTILKAPTISNIIAIEAPSKGSGTYTFGTISDILCTAYTGFTAAKILSQVAVDKTGQIKPKLVIDTGNWGTGAYGGNKTIMALLQLIAARLATVDVLIFHGFSKEGCVGFQEATKILAELDQQQISVSSLINKIVGFGFKWGQSDGN